ncbi:unnamed protein product [Coffea canephora]|uniref:Non-specific serine/threonine protein kinase n=1 Tax=Coffea canephora TaxID=49390 RepID=A0A068U8B6_COFCA|nr:unnamed protein product [Coffea canephora]
MANLILKFLTLLILIYAGTGNFEPVKGNNITLGSKLFPQNTSSWLSPSGTFAFGFYKKADGFAVGIWLQTKNPEPVVAWTANRDDPPIPSDAYLELSREGRLLLWTKQSVGDILYNLTKPATSVSLLDSGNLVFYNGSNVLWESFDYPTDTILGGQVVPLGYTFFSSASATDQSRGRFILEATFDIDGNFRLYLHIFESSGNSTMKILWYALQNQCEVKGYCGVNAYCSFEPEKVTGNNCFCFPGFIYFEPEKKFLGCYRNFTYERFCGRKEILQPYNYTAGKRKRKIILILAPPFGFLSVLFTLLAVFSFLLYRKRALRYQRLLDMENLGLNKEFTLRSFSYNELERATDGFKKEELGKGGFGAVHKGTFDRGRSFVAVKRLEKVVEEGEREGILYLHEECESAIIHCDIKPQNLLLDESWRAKISDFGLAKLLMPEQTRTNTHARGTRGYMAPEWFKNIPISVKVDIYSFGIVLLEIVCCRKNLAYNLSRPEETLLPAWAYNCFEANELDKLIRGEEVDRRTFERMITVALWCIQDEPALRFPMKTVMMMLEGIIDVPIPPCPSDEFSVQY